MREGPPLWLLSPVDDGFVSGEIWAEGLRFFGGRICGRLR